VAGSLCAIVTAHACLLWLLVGVVWATPGLHDVGTNLVVTVDLEFGVWLDKRVTPS
jgi:hypothetical protein